MLPHTIWFNSSGQLDLAERSATAGLELARRFEAPDRQWRAEFDLARILEEKKDFVGAEVRYREAIATIEALRSGLSVMEYRAAILENPEIEELYRRLIRLLLNGNRPGEAFEVAERDKARTFLESLGASAAGAAVRTGRASPVLKREEALRERVAALDQALKSANASTSSGTRSVAPPDVSHVGLNEELMNLSRAFLLSGAQHVVASLWSVDDKSTAPLMESFYRAMAKGASPAEALRRAEVELRRSHPDPFLWAPFILVSSN